MDRDIPTLDAAGLGRFQALGPEAINAVTERFYTTHGSLYAQFGEKGRAACREDLAFHLEFLRPVLEFGIVQPMVDYLCWLSSVLTTRDIPSQHLAVSLDWLAEFFAERMPAAEGGIIVAALTKARQRFLKADGPANTADAHVAAPWPECAAFETMLLAGDRHGASMLFESCLERSRGLVDAELHMIQPALYDIGKKWQNNQVTVTQEHLATAIAQTVMTHALLKAELPAAIGRSVVLACVEGNEHAVGLQMVADAFQLAGWEVQYLGANVPTGALIGHIGQFNPDLLGLSVSFAHQLHAVREIVARLTNVHGADRPPVIIGGLAINQFSRLANKLGADAWSPDACSAVDSAARLVTQMGRG